MEIEWSDIALDDLETLRDYIGKDSPHYARQFLERIFAATEKLTDHPEIGRQVSEAEQTRIRELIFQGYRIIYLVETKRIVIVTLIHGSRDLGHQDPKTWEVV